MRSTASDPVSPARAGPPLHYVRALALGLGLGAVIMAPQAWSVWTRGIFLDPDDAMRTMQIRDFMAGQGWFDLVPRRLSPEHPFPMHWSRLLDAPLAALERLFAGILPLTMAERAMRVAAPILFFAGALWASLRIAEWLAGARARLPAAVLFATSAELMTTFLPGHIHHHGVQTLLLLLAVMALLRSLLVPEAAFAAAAASALAVLSLGIGLQNLPYVVALAALCVASWIRNGGTAQTRLLGFGAGLLTAVPVFLLDVPPSRYGEGACDAFSAPHGLAALSCAVLCFTLTAASASLRSRAARLAAAGIGAASVLVLLATTFPHCLGDPMVDLDPVLRDGWMSGVGEALSLLRLVEVSPKAGLPLLFTLLAGFAATVAACVRAEGERRPAWLALVCLSAVGVAGCFWQVRVAASACALLLPGTAWLVVAVYDRVARRPRAPALLAATLAGLVGGGTGWTALAMALPAPRSAAAALLPTAVDVAACTAPESMHGLEALPPGSVLSTIDPGSAILAMTPHSVFAAPYHRDVAGIRLSLLALAAPPETARPMLRDAHVRYLALCRSSNETAETVATHPDSLSAALLGGAIPPWLRTLPQSDAIYALFEMR